MDVTTAITLLTVNLIVLSIVIVVMIIMAIVLIVKINKIAHNVQQTTSNVASITDWFSPVKVFTELAKAIRSIKNR